jgi:hypothetical protein
MWCGMGKSVSLFDVKIFLIPASIRQGAGVAICDCPAPAAAGLCLSISGFGLDGGSCLGTAGCCLRLEKGGQRRGHSSCGLKTL